MATSSTGTLLVASASLNTLTMRERITSANSSSRKWLSVPATSFRNFGGSTIRKS